MMRSVAGDHARFEQTYFSHYKGYYFTGDGARRDEDGCVSLVPLVGWWLLRGWTGWRHGKDASGTDSPPLCCLHPVHTLILLTHSPTPTHPRLPQLLLDPGPRR